MVDTETDFLNPSFLDLLLFKRTNIVIRPFLIKKKLHDLLALLEVFYDISDLDVGMISDPSGLTYMFTQDGIFSPEDKPRLNILLNPRQDALDLINSETSVQFITIESNAILDYDKFQNMAVFNKKKAMFSFLSSEDLLDKKTDSFAWCGYVIDTLKINGLDDTLEYLIKVKNAVNELYSEIVDFSMLKYYYIMEPFNDKERSIIKSLVESIYDVNFSDILPQNESEELKNIKDSIGAAIPLDTSRQDLKFKSGIETGSSIKPFQKTPNKSLETQIENPFESSPPNPSEDTPFQDTLKIMQEIAYLQQDYLIAFKQAIDGISLEKQYRDDIKNNSAEGKYQILRTSVWKEHPPIEFIGTIFKLVIQAKIKSKPVNSVGLQNMLSSEFWEFWGNVKHMVPISMKIKIQEYCRLNVVNDLSIRQLLIDSDENTQLPILKNPQSLSKQKFNSNINGHDQNGSYPNQNHNSPGILNADNEFQSIYVKFQRKYSKKYSVHKEGVLDLLDHEINRVIAEFFAIKNSKSIS
jgi:hypothetical protein